MKNRKLKNAFGIFTLVTVLSVVGGVLYLQSSSFADFIKHLISEHSPKRLGVVGDFKNLKLYFFPPGIGVAETSIRVQPQNVTKIPLDATIEAREIRINFAPIQMFSGTLMVDEFKVVGGSIIGSLNLDAMKVTKKKADTHSKLNWEDLFQLQISGINLEETYLHLDLIGNAKTNEPITTEFVVQSLKLKKVEIDKKPGFSSQGLVSAVKLSVPKMIADIPVKEAYQLQWNVLSTDEGITLAPFSADIAGLNIVLNGRVNGNILDEKSDLRLESELQLSSNLMAFFSTHFNLETISGELSGTSKISAKLRDLENTLKANFQVTGKNLNWKELEVKQVQGEGVVNLASKQIEIKKLVLAEDEGEVQIHETVLPLAFNHAFDAKLKLKNADLHWLGGAVIEDVYMLDGWVNGDIGARFIPASHANGKNWSLEADTQLSVDRFALTNQKWGKVKPKHYILRPVMPVKLVGGLEISSKGVDFKNLTAQLAKTKFEVTGGVHAKVGYEIVAKGPVELKEMDQIAESNIRGNGTLGVNVHGPSSNVLIDFDIDAKDAEYINLNFGELKGQLTYDDDLSEIRLKNIRAHQRGTFYSMSEGYLDLGDSDELNLPITVNSGRVEDIAYILDHVVKKIDWYPKTLTGEVHGTVEVGGKMDFPKMKIESHLEGTDWSWMNERARNVKMDAGYDQGEYYARNLNMTKTSGQVLGFIEFNAPRDQIEWNLKTENFTFVDIDFIDRLEVPARSKISIQSSGHGPMSQIQSVTEGKMNDTVLKGEHFEPSSLLLEMGEKTLRLKLDVFGSRLHSQVKYAFTPKQPSQFSLDLNDFDFSPLLIVLNPKLMDDPELKARIDGHVQLDFLSTQAELARGMVALNRYQLRKSNFELGLTRPIELPIQLGFFTLEPSEFKFKNTHFLISGEGSRGNVDLSLKGNIDMGIAEFFTPSIQKIQGIADANIRAYGPLKEIKVVGDINFENAYALMRWLQTPFEEIDGAIRLRQGMIYIEGVESYLADEIFSMSGIIETYANRFPRLDIKAQFEDNKVKMAPLDLVQARGSVWIHGDAPPYLLSGNLEVPQALWTKNFGEGRTVSARGDRFAPNLSQNQVSSSTFELDLNVNAAQGFMVKNDIMDAEFRGKIKMMGPPENPRMIGEGQLVQGKILFRDRPFNLESVKVTLDDPLQFNPKFSASAVSEVNQYKIRLLALGHANRWKAEFSSTPFLPENEIYSLLTSGMTSSDTGRFRSRDRSYVNQGEAASLILHSLDFSQDVQRKTGFQFDVEEAIDQQSASSAFRPQALGENVAAPKLVIKRNVGRKINLAFGSTVGVGTEVIREANAEYKLTPGMSFIGVWNAIEGVNTQQTRTSYGVDIRLNKKFK